MNGSPPPSAMSFGQWLKSLRLSRGMTQKQLADACGVTGSYICRLERGLDCKEHGQPSHPRPEVVEGIARVLEVPVEVARSAAGYTAAPQPSRFGAWLRVGRLMRGLSQEELAWLCNITGAYVSLLEREGEARAPIQHPSPAVVDAVARALGVACEEGRAAAGYGPPESLPLLTHERELIEKFRALPVSSQLDVEAEVDAIYRRHQKNKHPRDSQADGVKVRGGRSP